MDVPSSAPRLRKKRSATCLASSGDTGFATDFNPMKPKNNIAKVFFFIVYRI